VKSSDAASELNMPGMFLPAGVVVLLVFLGAGFAKAESPAAPDPPPVSGYPMLDVTADDDPLAPFRLQGSAAYLPDAVAGESFFPEAEDSRIWQTDDEAATALRIDLARERAAALAGERVLSVFRAVLARDAADLRRLLAKGLDPDTPLPTPPPKEFTAHLPTAQTVYYATREQNFTPLMLAAALGYREIVQILLEAGADRWAKTRRHKTYALWLAAKTGDVDLMRMLMNLDADRQWERFRILVDLGAQKMFVFEGAEIVLESPVSTGKKAKPTPPGSYVVTDKHREWTSSIYRVKMPHFLRLSCGEIGFHAGRLPGYPASSGCIRLPAKTATELYRMIPVGTLVEIE
jgi:hypothetical protein